MAGSRFRGRVTYVRSLDEIPRFENEAAEAEFWTTHSLAKIWSRLKRASVSGPRLAPICRRPAHVSPHPQAKYSSGLRQELPGRQARGWRRCRSVI